MRRKPTGGGYGGQHRKPRYQQGGGDQQRSGGGQNHYGQNRQRKNYPALREKYLNQARDAMSGGDRVMAEYFFQHADHCYRMMMEEGQRPRPADQPAQPGDAQPANGTAEEQIPANSSGLPNFLTANYQEQPKPVDPATVQNWEERDA